jgi:uncharacterized membrane protein
MAGADPSASEARMAELERRVAELERIVAPRGAAASPERRPQPVTTGSSTRVRSSFSREDWIRKGEGLLGRAGVVLVTLGLIFLFRYAVDRGWLTPELRIATGLVVGAGLLGSGLRFFADRPRYRQILMAGGVVVLFITGLAASELYGLVSGGVSLLFHGAVAIAAFSIASRQRDTVMASIATVGGLVPPAFLLQDTVAGPVLWLYLALITAWAALLTARHSPGAFGIIAVAAAASAMVRTVPDDTATRIAAIVMLVAVWLGFAALPLARSLLSWAQPLRVGIDHDAGIRLGQPFIVTLAVAAVLHEKVLPGPGTFEIGLAGAAAGFALLAALLSGRRTDTIAAHVIDSDDFAAAVAAGFASLVALSLAALPLDVRFLALAGLATTAFLAARPLRAPVLALLAHTIFAACVLVLLRSTDPLTARPAFDMFALSFAGAGVLAAIVAFRSTVPREQFAYAAGVFVAVHVLLATELAAVPGAPWLASAAYALVGSAILLAGLRRQNVRLQQAGMLSLALLVIRLFAHDLANVDTGVRIILFLAIGFGFLGLSYLFRGRQPVT